MDVFILDPSRLIGDILAHIAELKNIYHKSELPITDDEITLQKLCVKLETVLRHEQREKYSLLGVRRDYWNFIVESIPKDDSIKYVNAIPQLRTVQGKGRAYIRFCLVKKTLADSIQRCLVDKKHLGSWYKPDAVLRNNSLSTAMVNKLYDLNDIDFDLSSSGHDLDISWPAFSRRSFGDGSVSGRRSSVSSMTSIDYRNERTDPLLALSTEISALKDLFVNESPFSKETNDGDVLDSVSIADSAADVPSVSDMTLDLSRIHQQILKWKSEKESQIAKVHHALKKAEDEKKYAIQESDLRVKQMHEKQVQLSIISAEKSDTKTKELNGRLTKAENALHERDAEIKQLREDINMAIASSHEAQRSTIDLEKQLTMMERTRNETCSENLALKDKLRHLVDIKEEQENKIQEYKNKISSFEARETEHKEKLLEVQANLKAKEVILKTVQESFEKLNGMVFGSFEELESELKSRLLEREKGLESKSAQNRQLESSLVELQQTNRETRRKLSDTNLKFAQLETAYKEVAGREKDLRERLTTAQRNSEEIESVLLKVKEIFMCQAGTEKEIAGSDKGQFDTIVEQSKELVSLVAMTRDQLKDANSKNSALLEEIRTLEERLEKKDAEIERLVEEAKTMVKQLESFTLLKGQLDEIETEYISLEESLRASTEEKKKAEEEFSLLKIQNEEERARFLQSFETQLSQLKEELVQSFTLRGNLESELREMREKVSEYCSQNEGQRQHLESVREELANVQDEKAGLEMEVGDLRQLLEAANEGRILAQQSQAKAREQLETVKSTLEQEIAALKFQLSSEAMKFESEIKVLSDQSHESAGLKEKLSECEETITDLEKRLRERNDAWQNDKLKYSKEVKHLRNEAQNCKANYDAYKQKVVSMENELVLMRRILDEEKAKGRDMKRKVEEIEQQKLNSEKKLNQRMSEMVQDMKELKERLIAVTREKSDLWLKADDMEHCVTLKVKDRWIEDKEVTHCSACNAEFTLFLRKHHCRECGRIFCYTCSNNWIRTPHSRHLKRVCDNCIETDRKLRAFLVKTKGRKTATIDEDFDDTRSDTSESTRENSSFLSQGESDLSLPVENERNERLLAGSSLLNGPNASSSPKSERLIKKENRNTTLTSDDSQMNADTSTTRNNVRPSGDDSSRSQTSNDSEQFEIISTHEDDNEDIDETRVIIADSDTIVETVELSMNILQDQFNEVIVPAATRYIVPVAVRNSGSTLCWKFSTSAKGIVFGVGFKRSESINNVKCETLIPLAQHQSQILPVEGEIQVLSPGIFLLVFDNSFSRFTTKRLFYLVQLMQNSISEPELR